jgi:hypothetical protein
MTAIILILAGWVLMLLGAGGIWLAMNTPVQLQPIPLCVFVIGLLLVVFGMGAGI